MQPIRTKFGICGQVKGDDVQGILGAISPFWPKWRLGQVLRSFFCLVNHATFRELRNGRFSPNLVTKHSSVSRRGIQKDIKKNFHFRCHLPQNLTSKLGQQAPNSEQATTGQRMHCSAILFTASIV